MTKMCECGGTFEKIEGLEGMFCNKCNAYTPDEPTSTDKTFEMSSIYSEERLKSIRGVPHSTISIGSETKGRLQVMIPAYCTPSERKYLIDSNIDSLQYALSEIKKRGIDIMPSRKTVKKEDE